MRNKYITICLSMLLGISIMFNNTASAASFAPSFSVSPSGTVYAYLEESYIVDYEAAGQQVDAYGNYNVYVYGMDLSPTINLSGDGYITGSGIYQISFSPTIPTGYTLRSYDKSYDPVYTYNYLCSAYTYSGSLTGSMQIRFWCADQWSMGWTGLGNIHVRFTILEQASGSSPATPNPNLLVSVTSSIQNSNFSIYTSPHNEEGGLFNTILSSIDRSYTSQDINTILTTLVAIKNDNYDYYLDFMTYLNGSLTWQSYVSQYLSEITTSVSNIEDDVESIRILNLQLTILLNAFPSYSSEVLRLLGQIAQMSASDATAAAEMSSEYANKEQISDQIINDMNFSKPSFSAGDFNFSSVVDQNQANTFTGLIRNILSNSFFQTMFVIMFTLSIAGFALYGRR